MSETIRDKGLLISAILVGLAIPLLFFGKAWVGIMLGLAFIIASVFGNHKETVATIKVHLHKNIISALGILFILSAFNIPFSIRPELSIEAWFRTWILLSLIFYFVFLISDKIEIAIKSGFYSIYALTIFSSIYLYYALDNNVMHYNHIISKYYLNSFLMLIITVGFYYFLKNKDKIFFVFLTLIPFFIFFAFAAGSKSSIAALIILLFSGIFIFGIRYFSFKKTVLGLILFSTATYFFLKILFLNELQTTLTVNFDTNLIFPAWLIDHHRQFIWIFSYELFFESPFVGFGLNASNYHPDTNLTVVEYFGSRFPDIIFNTDGSVFPAHPHNWFLELALDGGLFLLLPLTICLVSVLYKSIKRYVTHKDDSILGFIFVSITYWTTGLLNFSFWSSWWQASYFLCVGISLIIFLKSNNKTLK